MHLADSAPRACPNRLEQLGPAMGTQRRSGMFNDPPSKVGLACHHVPVLPAGVIGRPSERRSNDGQVILEAPSMARKPGPDLLVCEPPYGIEP